MTKEILDVPRQRLNKQETRADVTDSAARKIIDKEATDRERKSERLKAARLAQEAAEPAPAPTPKKRAAKSKK